MSNDERNAASPDTAKQITQGVSEVFSATLGVGAAMAKVVAQATSGGKSVPEPQENSSPVNVMVHYGIATINNVFGAVVTGMNEVKGTAQGIKWSFSQPTASTSQVSQTQKQDTPSGLPTVHIGATLRIPLSIENPGPEPMTDLHFACLAIQSSSEDGASVSPNVVRFEPETVTIAPRDFEKLTVFIDVPIDAAPGQYKATIGPQSGLFETTFLFNVREDLP
jgi:hypothetical protein